MRHESDLSLHSQELPILALLLLLPELEDCIVQKRTECVIEELTHRHLLVIVWVLYQFQQVAEHVLVGAGLDSFLELLRVLVFLLDLLHKELHFFLELLVAISLIFLVSWIELDLDKGRTLVGLEHLNELDFALIVPLGVSVLLEFDLLESGVEHQCLAHEDHTSGRYDSQMRLL